MERPYAEHRNFSPKMTNTSFHANKKQGGTLTPELRKKHSKLLYRRPFKQLMVVVTPSDLIQSEGY
jgi:hypothetical protein